MLEKRNQLRPEKSDHSRWERHHLVAARKGLDQKGALQARDAHANMRTLFSRNKQVLEEFRLKIKLL
jgi:hypothetical protein